MPPLTVAHATQAAPPSSWPRATMLWRPKRSCRPNGRAHAGIEHLEISQSLAATSSGVSLRQNQHCTTERKAWQACDACQVEYLGGGTLTAPCARLQDHAKLGRTHHCRANDRKCCALGHNTDGKRHVSEGKTAAVRSATVSQHLLRTTTTSKHAKEHTW